MLTGRQAYLRAGLALAIPAILLLGTQGFDLDSLYAAIVGNQATTLLAVAFLIGLGIIELRCAVVLVRLCRARGNLAAYSATAPTEESLVCRRRWKYRCVVIVLSTVISFGLAELTLRVFDIQPPVPLPNYIQENQSVDNTRNALGIREDWDALSQDDARLRIAFLGDSMTYGYGVEQHESFCHLAEGLLSDDVPGGVVTINLGEPASGPDDHRTLYLSLRDELRPDLVLHVLYLNDLAIDLDPVLRRIYRVRDEDLRFASSSYVLRFAERQVRFWLARQYIREYFRGGANRAEQQAQLARLKAEVRACRRAVEEGGAAYSLILFPVLAELDNYPFGEVHEAVRLFALEEELPYLDLLDVFAGRDAVELRVSIANEHPNPEGHRIAALSITQHLRGNLLPLFNARP